MISPFSTAMWCVRSMAAAERIELPFTLINVYLQAAELHSNFYEKETEDGDDICVRQKIIHRTHFSAFMEQKGFRNWWRAV